ncbi:MAG: cytochrome c-type biogenesis protein CcmH/NrfG, partial [Candidatus Omnitrophota bacterium]
MKKGLMAIIAMMVLIGCGGESVSNKKSSMVKTNYIEQGMQYLKKNDVGQAIQSFDSAIKQDPSNVDNFIVLAQVYMRLQNYSKAIDTLNAAQRVDPTNGEVQFVLATSNIVRAKQEASQGRPDLAQTLHQSAVDAAKRSVDIYMTQRNEEKFKK